MSAHRAQSSSFGWPRLAWVDRAIVQLRSALAVHTSARPEHDGPPPVADPSPSPPSELRDPHLAAIVEQIVEHL